MTDETKKLFDAPWTVVSPDDPEEDRLIIIAAGGLVKIANDVDTLVDANRLARLPELYDALVEAKNEMFIILNEWALGKSEVDYLASYRERKGKNNYEFFNEIQELLRKVRDGE